MLAAGFWGLDRGGMWRDEAVTFQVARRGVPGIWRVLHDVDAVHGLYYLLMHAVLLVHPGEVVLRLPSVCAAAATAGLVAALGARLVRPRVGLWAGLLYAVTPLAGHYAQEGRSYALVAAGATGATLLFVRAVRIVRPGSWWAYGAVVAVTCWLHEFAVLLLLAHAVTLAFARAGARVWRGWGRASGAVVLSLVPMVLVSRGQSAQVAWLRTPTWETAEGLLRAFFGSVDGVYWVCLALAVVGLAGLAGRRGEITCAGVALPLAVVPPGVLMLASQVSPLYVDRYVLYALGGAPLLVACGAERVAGVVGRLWADARGVPAAAGARGRPRGEVSLAVTIACSRAGTRPEAWCRSGGRGPDLWGLPDACPRGDGLPDGCPCGGGLPGGCPCGGGLPGGCPCGGGLPGGCPCGGGLPDACPRGGGLPGGCSCGDDLPDGCRRSGSRQGGRWRRWLSTARQVPTERAGSASSTPTAPARHVDSVDCLDSVHRLDSVDCLDSVHRPDSVRRLDSVRYLNGGPAPRRGRPRSTPGGTRRRWRPARTARPGAAPSAGTARRRAGVLLGVLAVALVPLLQWPLLQADRDPGRRPDDLAAVSRAAGRETAPGDPVVFVPGALRNVALTYPGAFRGMRDIALGEGAAASGTLYGREVGTGELRRRLAGLRRVWVVGDRGLLDGRWVARNPHERTKLDVLAGEFRAGQETVRDGVVVRLYVRRTSESPAPPPLLPRPARW
ncbi:glycosyltransferase family 39 protein [Streptomyces sp. LP11]|uniref:Glycosyltransferase family 39 protein n=2 Tax=Streptomyces pyxinicus TaxID=2970331 RepID=A0ABT2B231_9ACTN|nr:glycosyltransferase family 39 protein [Streptomyces sp. LP11]MCS0602569.1 glycosyltransferase family 39 protein [Streptomyces sp. LP11]